MTSFKNLFGAIQIMCDTQWGLLKYCFKALGSKKCCWRRRLRLNGSLLIQLLKYLNVTRGWGSGKCQKVVTCYFNGC